MSIFELVRSGSTIRATAKAMSAETDQEWRPTVIECIVKRDTYRRERPGRIIDPRVWKATQEALASRRRRAA